MPASLGVSARYAASWNNGSYELKPDYMVGGVFYIGLSAGIYGNARYTGPTVFNFGAGQFSTQVTPSNPIAWDEKPWYVPSRYVNGLGVGVGVGKVLPIYVTMNPTYKSGGGEK